MRLRSLQEAASGILLLIGAVGALVWANMSPHSDDARFTCRLVLGAGGSVGAFTSDEEAPKSRELGTGDR